MAAAAAAAASDPFVPTSDQPRKAEWSGHFWYVMRAFALQASSRFKPNGPEALALVSLFQNLWVGLPCLRCKRHYVDNFKKAPYTVEHACCAAKGLAWIQQLRATIQAGIDAAAPPPQPPVAAVLNPSRPTPPAACFPALAVSNHSPEALARQERAIAAALCAKKINAEKGDCGCALKRNFM